jgi:H+/Cl- antiporter ClcA
MNCLCALFGMSSSLFHFELFPALPIKYIWVAAASGIICGICAAAFTKIYTFINHLLKEQLGKIPFIVKMICLFLIAGIIGFISADCLGSGHSLVDVLVEHGNVWYVLLAVLLIRVLLLIFANNIGATGGLFIPTLCFGAIIGSIISGFITSCGFIPQSHYSTIVILSIVAFLSAFVRTPVTAVIFSIEALGSVNNILPAIVAVTAAYITIEFTSVECFYETVIHSRVKLENMGKSSSVIDEKFTVEHGAFIVGKELRDILWPPNCIVLSVNRSESGKAHSSGPIQAGDVLHIHADTSDTGKTLEDLRNILGKD